MLFDLFACVDFSRQQQPRENPFESLRPYRKLNYRLQEYASEDAQVWTLHKGAQDHTSVLHEEGTELYIYGYCFPRSDSSFFPKKGRLGARQLARAYHELGADFIHEIKGAFAMLLIDSEKRSCQVFTDPFNVRPLYYYRAQSCMVFSTSLSAVMHHRQLANESNELNYPALLEYYLFEYPLNDDTFLRDVASMPAGGHLQFNGGVPELRHYWSPFDSLASISIDYDEEMGILHLEKILKDNLEQYQFNPERTAVALTGGYDSRANLALLGQRAKDYQFYSYGIAGTYDLSIPEKIAEKFNLKYKPIFLDDSYRENFDRYAELAIELGDGIAEANRANYVYAFEKLGQQYDYILTGLFGSEMIKHPTSMGNFISHDMKDLLQAEDQEAAFDHILAKARERKFVDPALLENYGEKVKERALSSPYINNSCGFAQKYFFFLLMVGIRKYFMKEIRVERPFVENLHPFLDLDFVKALLRTPFPWVHHWEGKRNLRKSLKTHRFYVSIIERNQPRLASMMSTHGYTPLLLQYPMLLPLMALQYRFFKKRIKARGSFNSQEDVLAYLKQEEELPALAEFFNKDPGWKPEDDSKNFIKLASLQRWLQFNRADIQKANL
ncbi:MAG: hypothetical protein ACLFT3_17135 [Cyclobacteriaceae bacterium]